MAVVGDLPPTDTTSIISIILSCEITFQRKEMWEHSESTLICTFYILKKKSDVVKINTN